MLHYLSMEGCVHGDTPTLFHRIRSRDHLLGVLGFSCSWEKMQKHNFAVLDGTVHPQYQDAVRVPLRKGSREEKGINAGALLRHLWCGFSSSGGSSRRSLCISTGKANSPVPSERKAWGKSNPAPRTESQLVELLTKVKGCRKWGNRQRKPEIGTAVS